MVNKPHVVASRKQDKLWRNDDIDSDPFITSALGLDGCVLPRVSFSTMRLRLAGYTGRGSPSPSKLFVRSVWYYT